jgi:hypothetical protein
MATLTTSLLLLANWRVVPVFEQLTQIVHVEPSLAAGTFHKVIGFTLRDITGITSAFGARNGPELVA